MNDVLRAQAVRTGYSHAPILHDVSITIREGEMVGVLGANGAGKTTLLRTLAGALRIWGNGSVHVGDWDVTRAPPWTRVRAGLGHVPEGRHVFAGMTVAENLDVARLGARGRSGDRQDVFDLFPRLAERRNQLAGSLSGGEQQMLAIGRALLTVPRVLLVDEMSAGLAPVTAQGLVEGLVQINRRGVAVVLVEQTPQLIADAVDRVYLLEQGRIVGEGSFEALGGAQALAEMYLGLSRA